jgi:membrane fusion protein (multidrug efflux system)
MRSDAEMKSRNRPGAAALGLLALLLLPVGCGDEAAEDSVVKAPPVLVEPVEVRRVVDRIRATGQLVAKAKATIAAQVNGAVTSILVEEGDSIVAGQALLEIDPQRRKLELADAEARLAEAQANVIEARRELDRLRELKKSNAASQSRLDEAQTRFSLAGSQAAGAEARAGLARRALEDATVRAPFAGLVARRAVSVGEYVGVGLPLFELVALDPIEVEFTLAEVDSARVALGNTVELRVAPFPDEGFTAGVTVIAPTIDPSTRTLRVKAELPNPDGRLRPGLFAHVDLGVSERDDVVMVPEDALIQRAKGVIVYRLEDGSRARVVPVRTGTRLGNLVEVSEGLAAGDRVVVRGQHDLVDGVVVSLRTPDGELADEPQGAAPSSARVAPGAGR